jgi:hypothetical protein
VQLGVVRSYFGLPTLRAVICLLSCALLVAVAAARSMLHSECCGCSADGSMAVPVAGQTGSWYAGGPWLAKTEGVLAKMSHRALPG